MAAILGIFMVDDFLPKGMCLQHYIDSQPALNAIVKGSSRQEDLNALVGALWYEGARRMYAYWATYVRSAANIADGPSRGRIHEMTQLGARQVPFRYERLSYAVEEWLKSPRLESLRVS